MADIRVLVADDEETMTDVLRELIETDPRLRLVGCAHDSERAIELALREHPDVALVDVRMPGGGGVRATREITRRCPPTRVVALSAHEDADTVIRMMSAGASAYVRKGGSTEDILRAIHRSVDRRADEGNGGDPTHATGESSGEVPGHPMLSAARRVRRRERVRKLLHDRALSALLQPIFELQSGRLVGAEALPWISLAPERSADAWFAEAEAAGVLAALELAFLGEAIEHLSALPPDAFLAVQVSPETIGDERLRAAVSDSTVAHRIVLEVTEHSHVEDYPALNECLTPIRDGGVRVAVRDVGAGAGSLRHVAALEPELVKIDTALTTSIERDQTRHAIVAALTGCATQVGARAIAEGIASQEQLLELGRLGVDYVQGASLSGLAAPSVPAGPGDLLTGGIKPEPPNADAPIGNTAAQSALGSQKEASVP